MAAGQFVINGRSPGLSHMVTAVLTYDSIANRSNYITDSAGAEDGLTMC